MFDPRAQGSDSLLVGLNHDDNNNRNSNNSNRSRNNINNLGINPKP